MDETPLNVPEILANVLQYVDSKTLVAAAQVNSMWANEATNWIWRGGYRISFDSLSTPLQRLSDCSQERRDWYTKKIRCLDLEIEYDESNLLSIPLLLKQRQFAFANARSVIVDLGSENMNEKDMVQFLSPSLLCLELYGGYYTRWFLEQVKIKSPLLQLWLVDNRLIEEEESSDALTADDFLDFLTSMTSIKHLELNLGWEPILDERVMQHIMLRPNLEVLNLGYYVPLDWRIIMQVQDEYPSDHIFPVLRSKLP
ncbi:hypothetical protein MW887_006807 [Aspergillus wentii]|nr:hypothetical protein MW887_006807 [Aspergillus wentii]